MTLGLIDDSSSPTTTLGSVGNGVAGAVGAAVGAAVGVVTTITALSLAAVGAAVVVVDAPPVDSKTVDVVFVDDDAPAEFSVGAGVGACVATVTLISLMAASTVTPAGRRSDSTTTWVLAIWDANISVADWPVSSSSL